jgi:hypothetical protein
VAQPSGFGTYLFSLNTAALHWPEPCGILSGLSGQQVRRPHPGLRDNLDIAAAAAGTARNSLICPSGAGFFARAPSSLDLQSAVAALESVVLDERLLDRVQLCSGQPSMVSNRSHRPAAPAAGRSSSAYYPQAPCRRRTCRCRGLAQAFRCRSRRSTSNGIVRLHGGVRSSPFKRRCAVRFNLSSPSSYLLRRHGSS